MARKPKRKPARQLADSVADATAAATANVLHIAASAQLRSDKSADANTVARLAQMCQEAAIHMAQAQDVFFDGKDGGEAALDHLDAALNCLNRLAAEGERHIAQRAETEARSA